MIVTGDFHGHLPPDVTPCDLLVLAGDCLPASAPSPQWHAFRDWLERQPAQTIVGIAGNHDFIAEDDPQMVRMLPWTYLQDEAVELRDIDTKAWKVWGSPRSNRFNDWAFMGDETHLKEVWDTIPDDVEIVVTHGPAHGFRDLVRSGHHVGSLTLRERLDHLPNLRLFACGHIHEGYGLDGVLRQMSDGEEEYLVIANGSYVDGHYRPGNAPLEVTL